MMKWFDYAKTEDTIVFISNRGNLAKMYYSYYDEWKAVDPYVGCHSNYSTVYPAHCQYQFHIDSMRGSFAIMKPYAPSDTVLEYYTDLDNLSGDAGTPVHPQSVCINRTVYSNCIIADTTTNKYSKYPLRNRVRLVDKYIIAKGKGLIYYRYNDGEEFYIKNED